MLAAWEIMARNAWVRLNFLLPGHSMYVQRNHGQWSIGIHSYAGRKGASGENQRDKTTFIEWAQWYGSNCVALLKLSGKTCWRHGKTCIFAVNISWLTSNNFQGIIFWLPLFNLCLWASYPMVLIVSGGRFALCVCFSFWTNAEMLVFTSEMK